MRIWDSSAIVPLLILERETEQCIKAFKSDSDVIVWTMSKVEVFSALCRRFRQNGINEGVFDSAKKRIDGFFDAAFEIVSVPKVKERALRLLQIHSLKAADALQLAAALIVTQEVPAKLTFMSFDEQLNIAAKREGFIINP